MMLEGFFVSLALMTFGHALGDYPLQNDFMARGKNWNTPVPDVPWYYLLGAHSVVHGGLAGLITGSTIVGILEATAHFLIDSLKNKGIISIHGDQALHIACKVVWAAMLAGGMV